MCFFLLKLKDQWFLRTKFREKSDQLFSRFCLNETSFTLMKFSQERKNLVFQKNCWNKETLLQQHKHSFPAIFSTNITTEMVYQTFSGFLLPKHLGRFRPRCSCRETQLYRYKIRCGLPIIHTISKQFPFVKLQIWFPSAKFA